MEGLVFSIKKFALHDGPGIRTTIFLKGCPLMCQWCHNPESISDQVEFIYRENKCISCNACDGFTISENCPTEALETVGQFYTPEKLFIEIKKDKIFYDNSGGGVTFSGGEPLNQSKFLLEMLKLCKNNNITTVVDTSGFQKFENIEPLLEYIDLFLYDIKIMDSSKHKKYTNVENKLIISNIKKISKTNKIVIRVPLMENINDDIDNIKKICELAVECSIKEINFLPYHSYSENKYDNLKSKLEFRQFKTPSEKTLLNILDICKTFGLNGSVGG